MAGTHSTGLGIHSLELVQLMTDAYAHQNITNLCNDEIEQNFTQVAQGNFNCNKIANITQNSDTEQKIDSGNTTDSNITRFESSPNSIDKKPNDFAVNASIMENTNSVLNYLLKNDKENVLEKTNGHIRNSLKRKKRSAENKQSFDEGQPSKKLPLIVNYKTNHYPRDREPISLQNPLKHSKLRDFNNQNHSPNNNKYRHFNQKSVESDERSDDHSTESTESNVRGRHYGNPTEASIENNEQIQKQYRDNKKKTELKQSSESEENLSSNSGSNEDNVEKYNDRENYTKRKHNNKNKENLNRDAYSNEESREQYRHNRNHSNHINSNENLSTYSGSIEGSPEQYSENVKQHDNSESNEGGLYKKSRVIKHQPTDDSSIKAKFRESSHEINPIDFEQEEQSGTKQNVSHGNRKESEERQQYPKSEETSYEQGDSGAESSEKSSEDNKFKSEPTSYYGTTSSKEKQNSSNKQRIHDKVEDINRNDKQHHINKDIKYLEDYTNDPNVKEKSSFIKQYPADFSINNFYGGNSREQVDKNDVIEKTPVTYLNPATDEHYIKPNNITQNPDQSDNQSKPPIPIQDIDLGNFSYERIKINNKGEVESLNDNQESFESYQPSIEIPPTSRPAKHEVKSELEQENLSNHQYQSSYTRNDNRLIHINDDEIKPVVELNLEKDSDESTIEDNSEPILTDKINVENINTAEPLTSQPRNISSDKLSEEQNNENVKQEFERIPVYYNYVDKENNKKQDENLKPLSVTVQTDIISGSFETTEETPINNKFDDNLNIKFNLEPIKLPEIKLPDDVLSYVYEEPVYDKNKSKYDDKEGKNTANYRKEDYDISERYPYHHRQENDDSNIRHNENYPYTEKDYYGYDETDEKQSYKKKKYNQDDNEEQNVQPDEDQDEDVDLYEKFVRERFGKRGSFGKRSEKLQNEKDIPYNPQLYKTIQNILKKTEATEKEAQMSGDPKAGYMWTLEYGDNL